jgi:transposase
MRKLYRVTLTSDERETIRDLLNRGTTSARVLRRAHILLHADEGRTDEEIVAVLHVARATVERIRQRFVAGNLERALREDPRPGGQRKLDTKQEAYVLATACSAPPDGKRRWTLQLLADRLVEMQIVEHISDETVRRTLKKTS